MDPKAGSQPTDAELVDRAKKNDLEAFDMLIARYERRVIGLCFRHFQQYEEACDLAQDIFLQAFRRIGDFEGRSAFATWLYRISLNACYNRHRFLKAKGRSEVTSLEGMLEGPDKPGDSSLLLQSGSPGALKGMLEDETRQQLRLALSQLELNSRKAVELVDIEGLSYDEAAEILKVPVNTVRSRLSRARKTLKEKILKIRKRLGDS